MLNDILILDRQWLPNQSDFPPMSLPWYRAWPSPIMSGFHGAFATGVACQQGTLTLPDTLFRPPMWDLLVLQLLRPDSSNLPCLYSTFHLLYPLVLFRFCFGITTISFFWSKLLALLLFSETYLGWTASCFVKIIWCSRWFCIPLFWDNVLLYLRSAKGGSI